MSIDWSKGTTATLRVTPIRKPEPGAEISLGEITIRLNTKQVADLGTRLVSVAAEQLNPPRTASDPAVVALAVDKANGKS